MKKMTPGDIEDWREDCRTGRTIMIPSSEFRIFLDAWEEREALKKALRRLQLDGQRATVCSDCASKDEALGGRVPSLRLRGARWSGCRLDL